MKTIKTRLVLLLVLAAVVPLLVYGAVSLYGLWVGTRESVINGNLHVARRAAEQIELYVSTNIKVLRTLASNLENTDLEHYQQDRILKNYVLQFPEYREITLFDESGAAVVSSRVGTPRLRLDSRDAIALDDVLMSPLVVDDDLLPTSTLVLRLKRLNQPAGWLVGELNLEELWRTVDRIRVGESGFALLIAPGGELLAHGHPDRKPLVAQGHNLRDHPLVAAHIAASKDAPASLEYDDPVSGERMLGVATHLDRLGWTIAVEQPRSEALAVAFRLQWQLFVAIALALLLMATLGLWQGGTFIRPIFELMRGTKDVAAGRLDTRVHIEGTREFEQLGSAFNSMADRLVELQEEIRRKERHAMFGRIAAGLVHDLAHPIQNIGNSCRLIVKFFDDLEYRDLFRRTVEREFEVVRRVLDDLRNVARPIPLERFPLEVNRTVGEVVDSMRPAADEAGVALVAAFSAEPLHIEGDVFALGRVYRNLITNAIQATSAGGRVEVATERADSRVEIRVADTGCGIAADRLPVIFEDFVTTKKRGLGLGLAISKKIVEQLGGTIAVTSEVGRGTTFVLQFPETERQPLAEAIAG